MLHTENPDNDVRKHYELKGLYKKIGDKNVWVEFTALAKEYNAVNLGQGFPDYQSLPYMNQKVEETLKESNSLIHQYTRSAGNMYLVSAMAKVYSKFFNRKIDPLNEILITNGAYGSLFNALCSFIEPGDEVIIIEPFFDCYESMSIMPGANIRFIPLKPKRHERTESNQATSSADWTWDEFELENAFNSKTKCIIINSPNNPLGKVYSQIELEKIANLCIKHNVLCISDEVYEHINFDRPHIRIATLPGMYERTVTIGSSGKSFSSTGVKLGWTIGPKELIRLCQIVHNNSIYCNATFFQEVIGRCFEFENSRLDSPECYFNSITKELKPKRDRLAKLLLEAGLTPVLPEGGYFMLADISKVASDNKFNSDEREAKDSKFVKYLIKEKGLATIPVSVFYSKQHQYLGENFIRFCFIKDEKTLDKAENIIKGLKIN